MPDIETAVTWALSQAGHPYGQGAGRFGPAFFDCSGLVYEALVHAGGDGHTIPTTSWTIARWCAANGMLNGNVNGALADRGTLLFEGPRLGQDGFGNDGHICFSLGDGRVIEARGRAYGVLVDSGQGRPWSGASRVPGFSYQRPDGPPLWPPNVDWHRVHLYDCALAEAALRPETDTLRSGSRGGEVADWQHALNAICGWQLTRDGVFGPATLAATVNFQRFFHATVDGVVGPQTRNIAVWVLAVIVAHG